MASPLSTSQIENLARMCAALGVAPRLQVLLAAATPQTAGRLTEAVQPELSRAAVSGHIEKLYEAGLLVREKNPDRVDSALYSIAPTQFFALFEGLRTIASIHNGTKRAEETQKKTLTDKPLTPFTRPREPHVMVISGFATGDCHCLAEATTLIGREPCDIHVYWDETVSRQHLKITREASDYWAWSITTRADRSYLNGVPMRREEPYPLRTGDLLQIGATLLMFRA